MKKGRHRQKEAPFSGMHASEDMEGGISDAQILLSYQETTNTDQEGCIGFIIPQWDGEGGFRCLKPWR